jgi:hypothetical protein
LRADYSLAGGKDVEVGRSRVGVVHVPGHTPGSVCLRLNGRAVVPVGRAIQSRPRRWSKALNRCAERSLSGQMMWNCIRAMEVVRPLAPSGLLLSVS